MDYDGTNRMQIIPPEYYLSGMTQAKWYGALQFEIDAVNNFIYYTDYDSNIAFNKYICRLSMDNNTIETVKSFGNVMSTDIGKLISFSLFFP